MKLGGHTSGRKRKKKERKLAHCGGGQPVGQWRGGENFFFEGFSFSFSLLFVFYFFLLALLPFRKREKLSGMLHPKVFSSFAGLTDSVQRVLISMFINNFRLRPTAYFIKSPIQPFQNDLLFAFCFPSSRISQDLVKTRGREWCVYRDENNKRHARGEHSRSVF